MGTLHWQTRRWLWRGRRVVRASCAAGLLALLGLSACQSDGSSKTRSAEFGGGEQPAGGVRLTLLQVDDLPSAQPRVTEAGPAPSLAQILARYASGPTPVDAEMARAWRGCGLRVVPVPEGEVEALLRGLNVVGAKENRWLGVVPQWVEVAHSPEIARSLTVRLDNGPVSVSAGTLRLMLRAWVAPVAGPGPARGVLQLEMVPDLKPRPERSALIIDTQEVADPPPISFWRLHLQAALEGGQALLVLPESPELEWGGATGQGGQAGLPGPESAAQTRPIGPEAPPAPTLGELLLDRSDARGRRTRTLLVLSAQVPREYRLLP